MERNQAQILRESKKLQESLIAGAKTLTRHRGREGRRRRVALPSLE